MFQRAGYSKGTSKECNVEVCELEGTEIPVSLKPFYVDIRKKLEYWKVDLRIE